MLWMLPALLLGATYSPQSLARELRALENKPGVTLPQAWDVQTPEGRYSISSASLRNLLRSDPVNAKEWLAATADELDSYSAPHSVASSSNRALLDGILTRPEFLRAERASRLEALRERLAEFILSILRRIFSGVFTQSGASHFLFWAALAVGLGFLGWWMWNFAKRRRVAPRPASLPAQRVQSSEAWARDAREAAAKGDYRQAIHCSYWAAVMLLREREPGTAQPGITPREYLRLFRDRENVEAPLTALTRALERFWYGARPVEAANFDEAKDHLRSLGCPLD